MTSATNTAAAAVVTSAPAIASGWDSVSRLIVAARYFRLCMYATSASTSAAGSDPYLLGIGGFLVDFTLAAISVGFVIHSRTSLADSFAPTPSSGLVLFPLPATLWQTWHFWAA